MTNGRVGFSVSPWGKLKVDAVRLDFLCSPIRPIQPPMDAVTNWRQIPDP